jgi:hypothetical protein
VLTRVVVYTVCMALLSGVIGAQGVPRSFNTAAFDGLVSPTVTSHGAALLDVDLTDTTGSTLHFRKCREVEATSADLVAPTDYRLFQLLRTNCRALAKWSTSTEADRTHFPRELTRSLVLSLPAGALPRLERVARADSRRPTVAAAEGRGRMRRVVDGGIELHGRTGRYVWTILGRGDFDGDGAEDLLLRATWHAVDAFGTMHEAIVVTRPARERAMRVIWRA